MKSTSRLGIFLWGWFGLLITLTHSETGMAVYSATTPLLMFIIVVVEK